MAIEIQFIFFILHAFRARPSARLLIIFSMCSITSNFPTIGSTQQEHQRSNSDYERSISHDYHRKKEQERVEGGRFRVWNDWLSVCIYPK